MPFPQFPPTHGPYVGAGPTIMFATEEKVTNMALTEVSQPEMSIAPAPGLVLQGGLDAKLTGRYYARVDVKYIALMKARQRIKPGMLVNIRVRDDAGKEKKFQAVTRIDTPYEIHYYQHGGILQYVLRQLLGKK